MADRPISDGVVSVCETCREKIDPDATDTVRAFELITKWKTGGPGEQIDGLRVFFPARHYPTGSRRYRRANQHP